MFGLGSREPGMGDEARERARGDTGTGIDEGDTLRMGSTTSRSTSASEEAI